MNSVTEDILMHYGIKRRSGRYPWGSGENPYQHSGDFLSRVDELKSQGMNDTEIARAIGLTTTEFRVQKSLAKEERRRLEVDRAKSLREDGKSLNEIAEIMGYNNDSSIRSLLNEHSEARMNAARRTAEFLKSKVDEKGMSILKERLELEPKLVREWQKPRTLENFHLALRKRRHMLTDMLLIEDTTGRVIYESAAKLATTLRVKEIVTVPVMENLTRTDDASKVHTLLGIIVNPNDYTIGADKGGAVNMFDDFDIDYNQQKYLIETRCSGALTLPYSAIAVEKVSA